jgi:hypothetical protein
VAADVEFVVRIDPREVAAFLNSESGPVFRWFVIAGDKVKAEAQRRVGVYEPPPEGPQRARRPGTLRDSIVKRVVRGGAGFVIEVGSEDEIALWHHEGTVPHVIVPVRAPRLVFWSSRAGRVVYATRVNHPGTQPNRYLTDALAVLR